MIQGRFVKEGSVTEVILPDGMTEIAPKEIQVFAWPKRRVRKPLWQKILVIASAVVPFSLFYIFAYQMDSHPALFNVLLALYSAWVGILVYANVRGRI